MGSKGPRSYPKNGNHRGPRIGTGGRGGTVPGARAPKGGMGGGGGGSKNSGCEMAIPVVVLLMPYALFCYWRDSRRG